MLGLEGVALVVWGCVLASRSRFDEDLNNQMLSMAGFAAPTCLVSRVFCSRKLKQASSHVINDWIIMRCVHLKG